MKLTIISYAVQNFVKCTLFVSFISISSNALSQDCPSLEARDLYNIKYINKQDNSLGYYAAARYESGKDSLNKWGLYKFTDDRCSQITTEFFAHIFDFKVWNDSVLIIGSRIYKRVVPNALRGDSTEIYAAYFFSKQPQKNKLIKIHDLHYYKFDHNNLIGITDTNKKTYYLSSDGYVINNIDGNSLDRFFLYPSFTDSALILRDTLSKLFTLGRKNALSIETLSAGDSMQYVQYEHLVLLGDAKVNLFYDIKKTVDARSDSFDTAWPFQPFSPTTVAQKEKKWFVVDSQLHKYSINWPDSLGAVEKAQIIPYSSNLLLNITLDGKRSVWWRKEGSTPFKKTNIPGEATLFPLFDNNVLYVLNRKEVFIVDLSNEVERSKKIGDFTSFNLKQSYFFAPSTISSPGNRNNNKTNKNYGNGFFTGEFEMDGSKRGLAIALDLNKLAALTLDTFTLHTEYLSLKRFFVFVPNGSSFFKIRDLNKIFSGSKNLLLNITDSIVVVKPFVKIDGSVLSKAIQSTRHCEECTVIIHNTKGILTNTRVKKIKNFNEVRQ